MAVLFILVSCLLHLVATAYFLFLEMLNKRDNGYVWVQMLWIIFHFLRLLMVVEPCHLAARESRKTIQIVCEIERKVYEPILAEEIKKFWQQLLVVDAEFSASGLCRVNRTILTSVSCADYLENRPQNIDNSFLFKKKFKRCLNAISIPLLN